MGTYERTHSYEGNKSRQTSWSIALKMQNANNSKFLHQWATISPQCSSKFRQLQWLHPPKEAVEQKWEASLPPPVRRVLFPRFSLGSQWRASSQINERGRWGEKCRPYLRRRVEQMRIWLCYHAAHWKRGGERIRWGWRAGGGGGGGEGVWGRWFRGRGMCAPVSG